MKYQINKGNKGYGGVSLFENIQFEIRNNEKIAVIGNNGCGKTTLMRIIANEEELDSGVIHKASDCRIGYLAQTTFANEENSVQEEMNTVFKEVYAGLISGAWCISSINYNQLCSSWYRINKRTEELWHWI